jgi:putative ABC transport system ATP-binding protein
LGAAIEFEDVTVRRGNADGESQVILDGVSLALPPQCRAAIIGPSGSGKTTLLRLINRLDDPDSGTIFIDGVDVRTIPPPLLRQRVGMLFQQPFLFDASIRDNLNRPLQLAGRPLLTPGEELAALERVDLPPAILERHSRDLSVGQQQRVALARALVLDPDILLLDEPTSALDPRSAEIILNLLRQLNETLTTSMLMVTHSVEHAALYGRQFLAISDGEVRSFTDLDDAVNWSMPGPVPANG